MELRLAVVQPETLTGADAPKNVDRAVAYIRQAARAGAKLAFDLFVDTEDSDLMYLESSTDGITWSKVPFTVRDRGSVTDTDGSISGSGDRHWHQASAQLAPGSQTLRWRYTSDPLYTGRGVYVDGVKIVSGNQVLIDGERTPESFIAAGWRLSRR